MDVQSPSSLSNAHIPITIMGKVRVSLSNFSKQIKPSPSFAVKFSSKFESQFPALNLQFAGSQATLYDITANVVMFVIDNKHAPSLASECGVLANKVVVMNVEQCGVVLLRSLRANRFQIDICEFSRPWNYNALQHIHFYELFLFLLVFDQINHSKFGYSEIVSILH
jgi:hypothetical protein